MKTLAPLFALLAALAFSTLAARADSGPVGIAFVQAEEGTWWCRAQSPDKGFACARQKCVAAGKAKGDCHEMRWCGVAAWSGTMVIWLPEYHATSLVCGAPSEAAVTASLKALCDNDEVVTLCQVTSVIDPEGKQTEITDIAWDGPTTRAAPSDEDAGAAGDEGEPPAGMEAAPLEDGPGAEPPALDRSPE